MRKILIILLVVLSCVLGYQSLQEKRKKDLGLNEKIAQIKDKISDGVVNKLNDLKAGFANFVNKHKENLEESSEDSSKGSAKGEGVKKAGKKKKRTPKPKRPRAVVLHLKYGGKISGRLVSQTETDYTIMQDDREFIVGKNRVVRLEEKTQKEVSWPYKHDVVVRRTNTLVSDAEIIDVRDDAITLMFREGGGELEMEVKRSEIEYLMFAPVCTEKDLKVEARLRELFPDMKFYRDGHITIVTDSYIKKVELYQKVLRDVYTETYFKFFKLFKNRQAQYQNYVVIFDDYWKFVDYALTDMVPAWLGVLGYFHPTHNAVYTYNAYGESMEKLLLGIMKSFMDKIDGFKDKYKGGIDNKYHIFVDGMVEEYTDRHWEQFELYRASLVKQTLSTVRHEFIHMTMQNWGLQWTVISKLEMNEEEIQEHKKKFLKTESIEEKKKLFYKLTDLVKAEDEGIKAENAQSWLVEGMAMYCATDPVGSIDRRRLYWFQEMIRKKEVQSAYFLTYYKMGSFPGLGGKDMMDMYAQSWAFVSFLMREYPDGLISFMDRIANETPEDDDEEIKWLELALGRDLPDIDEEFIQFIRDNYEEIPDPWIEEFDKLRRIWNDFKW